MTVNELVKYFSDRSFFINPNQEVRFVLAPEDIPILEGTKLELRGSTVPGQGEAVVALRPAPRKYMFSLKFEANPVIEAEDLEEANKKASYMMRDVLVVKQCLSGACEDLPSFKAKEPLLLKEIE